MKSIWHYKQDTLNGIKEEYYENGNLSSIIQYKNGVKDGEFKYFYKNGFISFKGSFIKGLRQGYFYEYFQSDSGKIKSESYIINAEDHEFYSYHKKYKLDGSVESIDRTLEFKEREIYKDDNRVRGVIQYVDTVQYDSMKIILGDYDVRFVLMGLHKMDTLDFENNVIEGIFPLDNNLVRCKFLGYKTFETTDSVFQEITVNFFETPYTTRRLDFPE